MRILNLSFKVISDSILESFALDFKNLAALGAKVSLALLTLRRLQKNVLQMVLNFYRFYQI